MPGQKLTWKKGRTSYPELLNRRIHTDTEEMFPYSTTWQHPACVIAVSLPLKKVKVSFSPSPLPSKSFEQLLQSHISFEWTNNSPAKTCQLSCNWQKQHSPTLKILEADTYTEKRWCVEQGCTDVLHIVDLSYCNSSKPNRPQKFPQPAPALLLCSFNWAVGRLQTAALIAVANRRLAGASLQFC